MDFSIVIATYGRPTLIRRCLEALHLQEGIATAEVIVVDDGSPEGMDDLEAQWRGRLNLRVLRTNHAGQGQAQNHGVALAKGQRILFAGDDIIVQPGWLRRHRESGQGDPARIVIGPYPMRVELADGQTPSSAFRRAAEATYHHLIQDVQNVPFSFFNSGNASFDRELFDRAGGFDPRFTRYGWEDLDLGYRLTRAGGTLIYDEGAKAVHAHPPMHRADLWRREESVGAMAWVLWQKWEAEGRAEDWKFMKFWADPPHAGPAWRRALGRLTIDLLERVAPDSPRLYPLYERLMYSYRNAGFIAAMRDGR